MALGHHFKPQMEPKPTVTAARSHRAVSPHQEPSAGIWGLRLSLTEWQWSGVDSLLKGAKELIKPKGICRALFSPLHCHCQRCHCRAQAEAWMLSSDATGSPVPSQMVPSPGAGCREWRSQEKLTDFKFSFPQKNCQISPPGLFLPHMLLSGRCAVSPGCKLTPYKLAR